MSPGRRGPRGTDDEPGDGLARGVALDTTEDLAQETWMRLTQQQRAVRLRELALPGLAVVQACRLALESARTDQRRRRLAHGASIGEPAADPAPGPEDVTADRERLATIEADMVAG